MNQERLLKIILSPHVSEKATTNVEKHNTYVFQVIENATTPEIKDAIEFLFNAKVDDVRVVSVKPKEKMFKGMKGKRKGWKKAYVTLQAGQTLEVVGDAK